MSTLLVTPALEEMIDLIRYQMEEAELTDNGWYDIFCEDCPAQETSNGRDSLEAFAQKCLDAGWIVNDLKRGKSLCPDCANQIPAEHWASQYEDGAGGILG
jgi:hypothetical protein